MQVNYNTLNKLHLRSSCWYRQKWYAAQRLSWQAREPPCDLGQWYDR